MISCPPLPVRVPRRLRIPPTKTAVADNSFSPALTRSLYSSAARRQTAIEANLGGGAARVRASDLFNSVPNWETLQCAKVVLEATKLLFAKTPLPCPARLPRKNDEGGADLEK